MSSPLSAVEQTLVDLIAIASPTGGEAALADAVSAWLDDAGWRLRRKGCALVADRGERTGERLGIFGHLDVVTDHRMAPINCDTDFIYGPGASDMKSGLAVMIELARNLADADLHHEPILVFYDQEEGPIAANGLAPLLDAYPDLCNLALGVCMEPTANTLQLGCVGSLHAAVTVHGRAGHSARPWEGVNAITAAAPLLARFAAWAPRPSEHGGLTFFDTLTVTQASGGGSRNSVPAQCSFNINRRFVPGTNSATALAELRAFVGDDATVELIDTCESAPVVEDSPLLDSLIAAGDLSRHAKQAWTDVAQLAERGIPGVNFGPGDPAWAHQAGERVRRADLRHSLAIMTRWLCA